MNLYKFYWDCGRMGYLDGLFIAEESDLEEAYDKEVYFGEVLGIHSEIYGTLNRDDISLISDDSDKKQWKCSVSDESPMGGALKSMPRARC